MAAGQVSDTTVPYEILLRFDEGGMLSGAHYQKRRIVTLDGEKLLDQIADPIPLSLVGEAGDLATLAAALGDTLTSAVAAADKATADLADREAKLAAAEEALQARDDQIASLNAANAEQIASLKADSAEQIAGLNAANAQLAAQMAAMPAPAEPASQA